VLAIAPALRSTATLPALLLCVSIGACSGPTVSDTHRLESASATPAELAGFAPGRPYDADAVFAALSVGDSVTEGLGLAHVFVNRDTAAALAGAVWTWNGARYRELQIESSCDDLATVDTRCLLLVVGIPRFEAAGGDNNAFSVTASSGADEYSIGDRPQLSGYPAELETQLELTTRSLTADQLTPLRLDHASWLPPPAAGIFALEFDDGNRQTRTLIRVWLDFPNHQLVRFEVVRP
jgi:hypothetical protein